MLNVDMDLLEAQTAAERHGTAANWAALTAYQLPAWRYALVAALASGSLTVSAGGATRTFRSIAELQSALTSIDAEIGRTARSGPRIRTITVSSASGW